MKKANKMIYVAGRYRGKSEQAVQLNVQACRQVGVICSERGWYPVMPCVLSAGFEHLTDKDDQFWLDNTLELMLRCDAVVMAPGWLQSEGATNEYNEAKLAGIAVYEVVDEVPLVDNFENSFWERAYKSFKAQGIL